MSNETIPAGIDQILSSYLGSNPATPIETQPTSFYQQSTDAGAGGVDVSTPVKQSATMGDYTKEFGASAVDSVGAIGEFFGEGVAAVANKASGTEDYVGKNLLKPISDSIRGSMTEGGKQAGKAANVEGSVVDLFSGKAKLPETVDGWLMMGANGLGSLVPMLVPIAGWVSKAAEAEKLAVAAVKIASVSGLASDIAKAAELAKAAKSASLTSKAVGATMEGSMTGGSAAGDVRGTAEKSVAAMTHEQLMAQVPVYSETFNQTGDQDRARKAVVNGSARWAAGLSAVAGAAGGAMNAKILEDFLVHKGVSNIIGNTTASRLGRGAISATGGAVAEGGQEVAEKIGQNAGENIGLGKSMGDNVLRDTAGDFLGGAMIGGGLGGAGGLTTRHNPSQPETPAVAPINPLIDQLAQANGPLSRATVAANPDLNPADVFTTRANEVESQVRTGGLLNILRQIGQPGRTVGEFMDALQIAKDPRAPAEVRQQAIESLNTAMAWIAAGKMPGDPANGSPYGTELSTQPQPGTELAPQQGGPLTDPGNPGFFDPNTVDTTAVRVDNMLPGPRALPAPAPGLGFTPEAPGTTPATTPTTESNTAAAGVSGAQSATETVAKTEPFAPESAPAAPVATGRTQVAAPKLPVPPGTGTAQVRQRKAQLQAMAADGFDTVERQSDGKFVLVNPRRNEAMELSGMGDAQMARKAISDYIEGAAHQAASSPQNKLSPPTDKQIVAENYKKGHLTINGMDVSVENPRHATRSGVSPDGKRWSSVMAHHYGYFKRTEGADGDALDVFIGSRPDSDKVFVIDQNNADGSFDEHKVMMGFTSEESARAGYLANYEKGWTGLGAITQMTVPQFKAWAKSKAALKPAAGYDPNKTQENTNDGQGGASASAEATAGLRPELQDGQPGDAGARDQRASTDSDAGDVQRAAAEQAAATDARAQDAVERISAQLRSPVALADPSREDAKALNGLLAIFARLTGKLGYATVGDAVGDGVSNGTDFFVNVGRPQMHVSQTIGHEFKHLSEKFPGLAQLYDRLWDLISEDGKRAYYENYLHTKEGLLYQDASDQQLHHLKQEMLADFMGKRFNDQPWLAQLAAQKPKLFGDFVRDWISALSQLLGALKGFSRHNDGLKNVDQYIAELEKAKAIAVEVAIDWAERHPKLAEQTGAGEILHSRTDPYAEFEFGQEEESSFDDFDLSNEDLQAEMEAEMAAAQAQVQARLSPPQLEVTDAEIKRAGLMAEDAFPELNWQHDPDARGMQQTVDVEGMYRPGKIDKVSMNLDRSGLWSVDLRGTWVGPAMNESDGYATEAAVKLFAKRQIAAIDLKERAFDLVDTGTKAMQKRLVDSWKSVQQASARKFGRPGRTARSLKEIAADMGLLDHYEVTVNHEVVDTHNTVQSVTFKHKQDGTTGNALLAQHRANGEKYLSANTAEMGKSGLGAAFYQMAAEYAARGSMTLRPEPFLSGINSYRRTEQQISAALRTGKSNVMVPHPVQRVYGFEDNATRIEQHNANLARLLLAGVRNARELIPGFDDLRYNPATGKFTDTSGKPMDDEVVKKLKDVDARAFGMGRGTLARSVLSHMLQLNEIKLQDATVFSEPVLYSERVHDEVTGVPLRTNIVFEVAPDPHDANISQAWNQLSTEQRLAASEAVTHVITPKVLAALGASGKQVTQIGSYLDDTNTSFALALDRGDALSVGHALGYVLSQDSMVVLSDRPFHGGDVTGAIDIQVGDLSVAEIDAIYQQLRAIKVGDEQPIGGQSTAGGIMSVLNFSNINNDELGQLIDAKLGGAYDVQGHQIYAAFPQKEDYNYDLPTSNPRGDQSPLWQALNPLRREAASLIGHYIDKHVSQSARVRGGQPSDWRTSGGQISAPEQGILASKRRGEQEDDDLTPLAGAPSVPGFHGPDPRLVQVAQQYARDNGITLRRQAEYAEIDKDRAKRLAQAYADMPHSPQDPAVQEAFANLIKQTTRQYHALKDAGYAFWFIDTSQKSSQDYLESPWNAMRDLRANQVMGIYPTQEGFGSGDGEQSLLGNPLEAATGIMWPSGSLNGPLKPVLANDLFRAVHDAFGHGLEGAGFRAQGEENAWQAHIRLFTGSAIAAITSETRGQNSWVNFGPHADNNQAASAVETVFADQKTGLMPAWAWTEGVVGDADIQHSARDPLFYSELTRQIEQSSMKQAPAGAWKSHIKALAQKGVKADEIEWSGVNEWLDLQEGKVSRQALADYLEANGVQVQETVLGESAFDATFSEEGDDGLWRVYGERANESDVFDTAAEAKEKSEAYNADIPRGPSKYSQYQLPGGENYREVLLTLPSKDQIATREQFSIFDGDGEIISQGMWPPSARSQAQIDANPAWRVEREMVLDQYDVKKKGAYKSSHWEQPNVLAHIRVNDRTDADGNKVLFVEELQSDWGQEAKKNGLALTPEERLLSNQPAKTAAEYSVQQELIHRGAVGVPRAPFITATDKWLSLALKRVVKMAVDGGYDKVAFVNGQQSADRYDLSRQVEQVMASKEGGEIRVFVRDNAGKNTDLGLHTPDKLSDVVGKDLAEKITRQTKDYEIYEGVDLKVGGDGMKYFYDSIVPNTAKEVIRKLGGGQMEAVAMETGAPRADAGPAAAWNFVERPKSSQPGFTITDAMRAKAATSLPLFSKRNMEDLETEQDHQDAAPKAPKTRPYAGKKVDIPVKIEDTGEVATLIMDVNQTLDDYDEQMENMKQLLECLA